MPTTLVKTGIDVIGDVPWGTHFCQFYQTKQDLIDILVPYFRAGLENNEFCMWITAEPLAEHEARQAMAAAMPGFAEYVKRGRIEILPHDKWYLRDGVFDLQRVLDGWVDKLNRALARGYSGMRVTGNTAWLERSGWKDFTEYEAAINNVIGKHKMMALCTYWLDKCGASEVIDVINNHQFALLKRQGIWERIESTIHKQTREALRGAELSYRTVAENTYDFEFWINPQGRYVYASPSCRRVYGRAPEEFVADPGLRRKTVHPDDFPVFDRHVAEEDKKLRGEVEFRILRPDGSERWVAHVCHPVFDELGEYLGVRGSNRDITDRKKWEQQLREKQQDLSRAQAVARMGSWRLDLPTNKLVWSPETHRIFGITSGTSMTYESFLSSVHPEDRDYVDRKWKAALRGEPYDIEHRILVDNCVKWVREKAELEFDDRGVLQGGFGTVQDITERKKVEEELRETRDYLNNLLDYANAPIIVWDPSFRITRFNHAFERLTGLTAQEVLGKDLSILFTEDQREEFLGQIRRTVAGEHWETVEIPILRTDGEVRTVLWNSAPLYDADCRTVMATIAQGQDITERKEAEATVRVERDNFFYILEAMKDGVFLVSRDYTIQFLHPELEKTFGRLQGKKCYQYFHDKEQPCSWCNLGDVLNLGKTFRWECAYPKVEKTYAHISAPFANPDGSLFKLEIFHDITERKKIEELKDEFIGLVSHEMRSPLTVITGALHTVLTEDEYLSRKNKRQLLEDAAWEAGSLAHILGNLLELSRAQANRLILTLEPVDLRAIVRNVIRKVRRQSSIHRFSTSLPRQLPRVRADVTRLERILHNLLENAVKYSPNGGVIRVSAKAYPEYLVISVTDQGIGISPEDQVKLFAPFQRLEDSRAERVKGVGLGLLVCRRLVEAHGGRVWVESKPEKGSTFFFSLPLSKDTEDEFSRLLDDVS